MYVQISMFWWPCVPNPRFGWTRSSFITRSTPNSLFSWLLYSAKEKWKRLLSQLALDHPRLSPDGFAGFPNHSGGLRDEKPLSGNLPDVSTHVGETVQTEAANVSSQA